MRKTLIYVNCPSLKSFGQRIGGSCEWYVTPRRMPTRLTLWWLILDCAKDPIVTIREGELLPGEQTVRLFAVAVWAFRETRDLVL